MSSIFYDLDILETPQNTLKNPQRNCHWVLKGFYQGHPLCAKCSYNDGKLLGGFMPEAAAKTRPKSVSRESSIFGRIERKLGTKQLQTDGDLARLVEARLPVSSIEALSSHGLTDEEIYTYILPRRTLVHRRSKHEALTHDESDKAVRLARIASLAEEVFGEDEKAGRWLRKPKQRFEGRTPLEVLKTEAGARLVEEMLLQLDYGFFA
jgi:putative toxin-antitoxin system antitoxin component (TIGR02293 family)